RGLTPGGDQPYPLRALVELREALHRAVDAGRAAVDLAGPQVHQLQRLLGDTAGVHGLVDALNRLRRAGEHGRGVLHASFQLRLLHQWPALSRALLNQGSPPPYPEVQDMLVMIVDKESLWNCASWRTSWR